MPYRKRDIEERAAPEGDAGIVGDLVRQFADPYAFFRELVQNAIDAGSPDIRVDIARDGDGALLISLRDGGEGMDRETLETKLLVLFRSGKEGVAGKIGKFGIGFVSVLAIGPTVVKVQSTRGGLGHTLHLYADHSYELFEHSGARAGTTVTLVVPLPDKSAEAALSTHVTRSRVALQRWCEHAQVPITLHVDSSALGDGSAERIDRPMQLDGALCVGSNVARAGGTTVVVGLSGQAGQRASFYNRGLLLAETEEDLGFAGLLLKVQDAHLEHTLSRDNVRRDAHFARVLDAARSTVRGALWKAVNAALAAAAPKRKDFRELAAAVALTRLDPLGFPLPVLPVVQGAGGSSGTNSADNPPRSFILVSKPEQLRGARSSGVMTSVLAKRGEPVVDLAALPDAYVRRLQTVAVRIDETWLEQLSAVDLSTPASDSSDARLLAEVAAAISEAYRDPRDVLFGVIHGAHATHIAIGHPDSDGRPADPFALLPFRRAPLILNAAHPLVLAARTHATESVAFAADMLTRAVLATHGALSGPRSERLLLNTLDALTNAPHSAPEQS